MYIKWSARPIRNPVVHQGYYSRPWCLSFLRSSIYTATSTSFDMFALEGAFLFGPWGLKNRPL